MTREELCDLVNIQMTADLNSENFTCEWTYDWIIAQAMKIDPELAREISNSTKATDGNFYLRSGAIIK